MQLLFQASKLLWYPNLQLIGDISANANKLLQILVMWTVTHLGDSRHSFIKNAEKLFILIKTDRIILKSHVYSRQAWLIFELHFLDRFFWTTSELLLNSLFFVSGPCARLSWPSRQHLSTHKSTVPYRIVSYRIRGRVVHHHVNNIGESSLHALRRCPRSSDNQALN